MAPIRGTPHDSESDSDSGNDGDKYFKSLFKDQVAQLHVNLHALKLDDILRCPNTLKATESLLGIGVNPFLLSPIGSFRKPNGKELPMNTNNFVRYWKLTAQRGSIADKDKVEVTTLPPQEFYREVVGRYAQQLGARGPGIAILLSYLCSGAVASKVREIIFQSASIDWAALTCWQEWAGRPKSEIDERKQEIREDFTLWANAWGRVEQQLIDAYTLHEENEADLLAQRVLDTLGQYYELTQCQDVTRSNVEFKLRKENEFALQLRTTAPAWPVRRLTRKNMIVRAFGNTCAVYLQPLTEASDLEAFNLVFDRMCIDLEPLFPKHTPGPPVFSGKFGVRGGSGDKKTSESNPRMYSQPGPRYSGGTNQMKSPESDSVIPHTIPRLVPDASVPSAREVFHTPHAGEEPRRSARLADQRGFSAQRTQSADSQGKGAYAGGCSNMKTLSVNIGGYETEFGVDSGLDLTLISNDYFQRLRLDSYPTRLEMRGLGGSKFSVHRMARIEFEYEGERVSSEAGVVDWPLPFSGLIGNDILTRHPKILLSLYVADRITPQVLTALELSRLAADMYLPVMDIEVDSPQPSIRQRGYPTPPAWRDAGSAILDDLVSRGILEDVTETHRREFGWISSGFFVRKPTSRGTDLNLRFVCDFRMVNKRLLTESTMTGSPLERFCDEIPHGHEFFASLDIKDAFYLVPVAEASQRWTRVSVVCRGGSEKIYKFKRGPQGLSCSPRFWGAYFSEVKRVFEELIASKGKRCCLHVYVDDVLISAPSLHECRFALQALRDTLDFLNIEYSKVVEPTKELSMLGMRISSHGWRMDTSHLAKLRDIRITDRDSLKSALGLVQYLHNGYPSSDFADNAATLSQLLKKGARFEWCEHHDRAWEYFQTAFDDNIWSHQATERLKDGEYWFIQTDASDLGLAVVLWRVDGLPPNDVSTLEWLRRAGRRCYVKQHCFTAEEIRYPVWDRECLAVFFGLNAFQQLFLLTLPDKDFCGRIVVCSDSSATVQRWTNLLRGDEFTEQGTRLRRWKRWYDDIVEILDTGPVFQHIPGVENGVADLFSRVLCTQDKRTELPLGAMGMIGPTPVGGGQMGGHSTDWDEFDYSEFLSQIKTLQRSPDNPEQYKGIRLNSDIPDTLIAFTRVDGLLYFQERVYIPPGYVQLGSRRIPARQMVVYLAHGPSHCGQVRTLTLLKKYWWPRLDRTVTDYIRGCHQCQLSKAKQGLYSRLSGRSLMGRFDSIVLDHTKATISGAGGETHVLVICDEFTRFAKYYPCKGLGATDFLTHVMDWISFFGFPRRIICDNHPSYQTQIWKQVLAHAQCELVLPPVYYPQSQGQAEHHMATVKQFISNVGECWPTRLGFLGLAHNSVPLTGSQVSPFDLTLGSTPRSLVDLLSWDLSSLKINPDLVEYHKSLVDSLDLAQEYHRDRVKALRQQSRDGHNVNNEFYSFKEGDEVIYVTSGAIGRKVHGVFTILKIVNQLGTIFDLSNGERVSLSQLIPYVKATWTPLTTIEPPSEPPSPVVGAMVLVLRADGLVNVGRCVENLADVHTTTYVVYTYAGGKWVENPGVRQSCSFSEVLDSGFKLTANGQFRSKDRKLWRSKGWDF